MSNDAVHPCCLDAARRFACYSPDTRYRARVDARCAHSLDAFTAAQTILALALQDSESGFFEMDYAALEARALLSGDLSVEAFEKFITEADK